MAKVLLDSKYYEVSGGIRRRNINPRAARFDTGQPGYASFTQANVEVWRGLRGGIGHKFQKGHETEECYFSDGVDASHDGGIILGPKVTTAGSFGKAPIKIIDFNDKTYAVGDDLISEWNTGTSAWDSKETGISDPIDAIVVTDSTATYFVVSNATSAKYSTDASSWSTLTGCMGYLAIFDNKLYGYYGGVLYNSPAKAADGTWDLDGTWENCKYLTYVGTPYGLFSARSLNSDEPILCLHSSEGLFTIDPWVQEMYKYLDLTGHTHCGHAGMFWNSYIYVSSLGGIKKISRGLVTDVGPDQDDGLPSTMQGYVYDMCPAGDNSWMVFSVHNKGSSDKSSIFKRHGTVGGIQQIYSTSAANTAITCVHYSPSHLYTNGRLWWGEGTNVKYCMFPDYNADVNEIGSYEFVTTSGKLVLPVFRPLSAINKLAIRVRATTKGMDANKKFNVSYRTNANCATAIGSNWTSLGSFATSPSPTDLDFASGAGVEFKQIQFAVDGATNSSTATPELLSLEFDYDVATKRIRGWTFNVLVGQHNTDTILDNLHTSQDKDTLLVFYPSGSNASGHDSYYVKITNIAENVVWSRWTRTGTIQVTAEELIRG